MESKRSSSYVFAAIAIIMMFLIAEQAMAITVEGDCFGPCTDKCQSICISKGYADWFCSAFRTETGCCCKKKKLTGEEIVQSKN